MRLSPRARSDRVEGIALLADGTAVLRVAVTALPEDGRANEALLRLLAKQWSLARRDLALVVGARSRNKVVQITGDPVALMGRLATLLADLPEA